jgi:hypothetical protein
MEEFAMYSWLNHSMRQNFAYSKKIKHPIFLVFLIAGFCSILALFAGACAACQSKTILEHKLEHSGILRIRTVGCWVGYIPVYIEIEDDHEKIIHSNVITTYSKQQLEAGKLEIEIHEIDTLIYIYRNENPERILSLLSLDDDLIYPRKWKGDFSQDEEKKVYYYKVRKLFQRLKQLLDNEDLELYGLFPQE